MATNLQDGRGGYTSEINITPLVDVVLVLLIIFMVIVPVMMRGYDIDLPGEAVARATADERPEQIVLQIDLEDCSALEPPPEAALPAACIVRLNEETIGVEQLAARVSELFADRAPADRVLFLAAHQRLNYEAVMRILDSARSGVEGLRIGFVTQG